MLAPGTPAPAIKWNGFPKYNFIGGHNDAKQVPVDALIAAATTVLKREGASLATYGLNSGPLGYRPLREFLAGKLKGHAGIACAPDEILITAGSGQGLDLVNSLLLAKGDTVLVEQETYGGALTKLTRLGVNAIGIPLDEEGLRLDPLKAEARGAEGQGHQAQVHLHHPDGAESDRRHHGRGPPRRAPEDRRRVRRHDLRGRVLFRPDLGRQAAALALRHGRAARA